MISKLSKLKCAENEQINESTPVRRRANVHDDDDDDDELFEWVKVNFHSPNLNHISCKIYLAPK